MPYKYNRNSRIATAKVREQNYRSPEDQLKHLDSRGFRAEKERAKIAARLKEIREAEEKKEKKTKKKSQE